MRLTSSVKELGAILQKLIKIDHLINLDYSWSKNETNDGFVGDADELLDEVVGSGQRTETNFVLTITR
jgi:hypothetical protein